MKTRQPSDREVMARVRPSDPREYAVALRSYAGHRLEPPLLRAWMIQRLMTDSAVDHGYASLLTDDVMAGRHPRNMLRSSL